MRSTASANAELGGKTVMVTGATSGIGLETSVALARMGAQLVMVGRDRDKTAQKVDEVRSRSGNPAVDSLLRDASSQAQIRQLAQDVLVRYRRLEILINNVGTVFATRTLTEDGVEATLAVEGVARLHELPHSLEFRFVPWTMEHH